jgi:4'-phosphopantetheinyl transferase
MTNEWRDRPAQFSRLEPGCVDVWAVRLDQNAAPLDWLRSLLSPDERARADRFHFERDRRRFTRARAVLRQLLGEYLGMSAREVRFSYGPNGKPALADAGASLTFNVSHSHELAVMAFGDGVEIGVDVEAIRAMDDAQDIATRFFSPRESAQLQSLPEAVRTAAFFTCWTRKEGYLKALGSGLAKPLDEFDVTFAPGEAAALAVAGDPRESARWTIAELLPAPGYVGALVTEGHADVRGWLWIDGRAGEDRAAGSREVA